MEVRSDYTYETFPEYEKKTEGAIWLETSWDQMGVYYIRDVEYCLIDGHALRLQILVPYSRNMPLRAFVKGDIQKLPADIKPLPCIVHVQGSAWMEQDLYGALQDYAQMALQGFVVAVVEYRHSGIAPFPAQIVDARNAVRYMKLHAEKYHIDPEKIILSGNSSGGHTAVYAGIYHNDNNLQENLYPGISGEVCGIINQYGSTDLTFPDSNPTTENHNMPDSPEGLVMGGRDLNKHPELAEKLTVRCNISAETEIAPVLNMHGTKDRTVNTMCSVYLYEHLKKCGKETYLYLLKGADHGGPEFYNPQAIKVQVDFIKKCINKG